MTRAILFLDELWSLVCELARVGWQKALVRWLLSIYSQVVHVRSDRVRLWLRDPRSHYIDVREDFFTRKKHGQAAWIIGIQVVEEHGKKFSIFEQFLASVVPVPLLSCQVRDTCFLLALLILRVVIIILVLVVSVEERVTLDLISGPTFWLWLVFEVVWLLLGMIIVDDSFRRRVGSWLDTNHCCLRLILRGSSSHFLSLIF